VGNQVDENAGLVFVGGKYEVDWICTIEWPGCPTNIVAWFPYTPAFGKLDWSGNDVQWGNGNDAEDAALGSGVMPRDVIKDKDDDYVVWGYIHRDAYYGCPFPMYERWQPGNSYVYVFEGASGGDEGDLLWSKTNYSSFYILDLVDTGDYYAITGRDEGSSDLIVAGLSKTNGSVQWEVNFSEAEYGYSIEESPENGGLIVAGYGVDPVTGKQKAYLLKVSDTGTKEWSKFFTSDDVNDDCIFYEARETRDRGYFAYGRRWDGSYTWRYAVKTRKYGDSCSDGAPCY
jgi:hypothetical protein